MGLAEGNLRMSGDGRSKADKEAAAKNNPELAATTPQGEKYFKMALKCWGDGDFRGSVMQMRFAMQFEPGNAVFVEWLSKAEEALESAAAKKDQNPYKLRIV